MSESLRSEAPPATAPDRRKPRRKTFIRGLIVLLDGTRTVDSRIEDVSESGARISVNKGREIPEHFYLLVTGKEFAYEAKVVWTGALERGLHFIKAYQLESVRNTELDFLRRLKLERLRT